MSILDFAESLPDHRQQVKVRHKACDIVFITVAAVICGAQDWEDALRKRAKNSLVNFSIIFKTVLAMLKKYTPSDRKNTSVKRKMAGWSDKYLLEMMGVLND